MAIIYICFRFITWPHFDYLVTFPLSLSLFNLFFPSLLQQARWRMRFCTLTIANVSRKMHFFYLALRKHWEEQTPTKSNVTLTQALHGSAPRAAMKSSPAEITYPEALICGQFAKDSSHCEIRVHLHILLPAIIVTQLTAHCQLIPCKINGFREDCAWVMLFSAAGPTP